MCIIIVSVHVPQSIRKTPMHAGPIYDAADRVELDLCWHRNVIGRVYRALFRNPDAFWQHAEVA